MLFSVPSKVPIAGKPHNAIEKFCFEYLPQGHNINRLDQGCPTRGPRKGFKWPAQDFLKSSALPFWQKSSQKSKTDSMCRPHFSLKNIKLNTSEDLFFIFREHLDFGMKIKKYEAEFK